MHAGHLYSGWDHCYPNCTPVTMTVQPPPLTLSIMSPAHYSPGHPACIKPHKPCAPVHCWDGNSHHGYHGLAHGAAPCFTSTSQKCLPRSKSVPCRTYWAQEPPTADWEWPTTSITSRNVGTNETMELWSNHVWSRRTVLQLVLVCWGVHPQMHI